MDTIETNKSQILGAFMIFYESIWNV